MDIFFQKIGNFYQTRLGNTEARVSYDSASWHLHWIKYETLNACANNSFCKKLNCDLDDLKPTDTAKDEYCNECPHQMSEREASDLYTSNDWNEAPRDLEEARCLILEKYKVSEHNGLYPDNSDFCNIMYGTWYAS